jgi:hypothetical protein
MQESKHFIVLAIIGAGEHSILFWHAVKELNSTCQNKNIL